MKIPALLFLALLLGSKAEEAAQCKVLIPGEVKTWEGSKTHKGMTRYVRWGIDMVTMNEERIVENADGSVRGRVITTYKGGRQHVVLAFRGMSEPWFTEHYSWGAKSGYSVERRSIAGEVIIRQIFPEDDEGLVQTLDSAGKEITAERYKELSDEVAALLF